MNSNLKWVGVVSLVLFLLSPFPAQAEDKSWIGGDGWWNDGSNWSPSGQPQDGDIILLDQSDSIDRTVWYHNTAYPNAKYDGFRINATGTGTMTLVQTQHSLTSVGIGVGTGAVIQSGGTNSLRGLTLGNLSSGSGSYTLSGTAKLSVSGQVVIGQFGSGSFTQNGGTHKATGIFWMGGSTGSSGSYNLTAGSLLASSESIGVWGNGSFIQSGGSNGTDRLILGYVSGSEGSYSLSGTGNLSVNTLDVGMNGNGSFTQSGGTTTVTGYLFLAEDPGVTGSYNLSAGNLSTSNENIGREGAGLFTQNGGTNSITSSLNLASAVGSSGTYNLSGGNLSANTEFIGFRDTGIFTQTGGTNSISSSLTLGRYSDANGTYTLNDGAVTVGSSTSLRYDSQLDLQGGSFTTTDMTIADTSYLTGGVNGLLEISGDLTSSSTQSALWDTTGVSLLLTGGTAHDFSLTGLDLGATLAGYNDNFAWGSIMLDSDSGLNLLDGNFNPGAALYVGIFQLEDELSQLGFINSNGFNIYYKPWLVENAYLSGLTHALAGGGSLTPVPEPLSILLFGTGLIGMAGLRKKKELV